MKKLFIIQFISFSIFTFFSCGGKDSSTETKAEADNHNESLANSNTASLTAVQMKNIGIELGLIEEKQLTASLKTNGVLRVPNQNKASVNSNYNGVIKSLFVQPGTTIRKGQTIATISNPEFIKIQSDYLNVNIKISLAELEVKRQQELNEGNAGSLKNLQSAETELKTLRTAKATYEQEIRLMGINPANLSSGKLISVLSISSPISGVVSAVKAEIGSYVDLSTVIAEIVDNSQLHLDLFVYEKDLSKLKNNQLIHFTLTNDPGKEYDAQIFSLGSSFEGESKAVTVHAKVQGDKTDLIDGMNITAVISLEKATVPAVPSDAIVTYAGQDFIFIVTDANQNNIDSLQRVAENSQQKDTGLTFEKIPVAKGTTDVGYTEITLLKDIPKDVQIVVKGAFFVLAKMTNSGDHEH